MNPLSFRKVLIKELDWKRPTINHVVWMFVLNVEEALLARDSFVYVLSLLRSTILKISQTAEKPRLIVYENSKTAKPYSKCSRQPGSSRGEKMITICSKISFASATPSRLRLSANIKIWHLNSKDLPTGKEKKQIIPQQLLQNVSIIFMHLHSSVLDLKEGTPSLETVEDATSGREFFNDSHFSVPKILFWFPKYWTIFKKW